MTSSPNNSKITNRFWKWVLGIITAAAALFLSLHLLLNVFLNSYLERALKEAVRTSTREAYLLDLDELSFGILEQKISLRNITLAPDSTTLDSVALWKKFPLRTNIAASHLFIQNPDIWNLIINRKLHIKTINLRNPEIFLIKTGSIQKSNHSSTDYQNLNRLLYKAIHTHLESARIERVEITDASLKLLSLVNDDPIASFNEGNIILRDINIDSTSGTSKNLFITNNIELSARSVSWNPPKDSLYKIRAQSLDISASDNTAFLDSLQVIPRYATYKFSGIVGTETDRIDLHVEHLGMRQFAFDSLLMRQKLDAQKLLIQNARLRIFRDKRRPATPNLRPEFPHLAFKGLDFPVQIDTISVSDSFISYAEHIPGVTEPGNITFEDLEATIYDVTNNPEQIGTGHIISMNAQTNVMGTGQLEAHFSIPMHERNGFHTIYGNLKEMPIPALNPILENVAFIRVESGYIHSLHFSMSLNKEASGGELILDYENLNITLLDKDSPNLKGTKELESLLANALVIKKSNHGEKLRKGKIKFERLEHKSVLNFWWKSLLSGIKDTIGL